jgi:hypothetical protein
MARNAASIPSDMPEVYSDSDEDAPNQRCQPPPSRNNGRAAASAARPAARSDGPAVRNPANSNPNPNSSEREAQPGAIPRGGKGNVAPVSQQQNSHVPIPSSALPWGIDFGNANCVMAGSKRANLAPCPYGICLIMHTVARRGGIDTICNEASQRQTACMVSFFDKERFFGEGARTKAQTNVKVCSAAVYALSLNSVIIFRRLICFRIRSLISKG